MFWRKQPDPLYDKITELGMEVVDLDKEAGEPVVAFERMVRLYELREKMKRENSISKDTLLIVAANLLGIILVIRHEHVNVITSRAMQMVINPRAPKP